MSVHPEDRLNQKNFWKKLIRCLYDFQLLILLTIIGFCVIIVAAIVGSPIIGSLGNSILITGVLSQIIKSYFDDHEKRIFPMKKDIENVFEKRSETYRMILDEMEKSSKIFMLGTAHRSFLWKETVSYEFYQIIDRCELDLRIVLSNPFCEQFVRRALIEEKNRLNSSITGKEFVETSVAISDIKQSIRSIKERMFLHKTREKNFDRDKEISKTVFFSNDYPLMWLIITDEYAFFQPYQYGNLENKPIMGENFFVLQIKEGDIYDRLESHFEYLWDAKDRKHSICSFKQIDQMMFPSDKGIEKISDILKEINEFDKRSCSLNSKDEIVDIKCE